MSAALLVPELFGKPRSELLALATEHGLDLRPHLTHDELVAELVTHLMANGRDCVTEGELSMLHEGFGFVRLAATDYAETAVDAYVSPSQIRGLHLQQGHRIRGRLRAPRGNERFLALTRVESVQGVDAEQLGDVIPFAARTAVVADRPLALGNEPPFAALASKAPWRFGQRVLVHADRSRPTSRWLADLAASIATANPSTDVTLCLLDQRPEDLAAARRHHQNLTTVGTTFAAAARRHADVADLALHAAMRRVEHGRDAVLLLDSLTALTHAHARSQAPSGAWIQPGLDAKAILAAKHLFAAARQTAEGGSLTVLATLTTNASPLDQTIAHEFAPTSNSDVWPDDLERSRTRAEGLN